MDTHSKEVRSYNMSRIRSKNNKPEEIIRKYLFSKGFRYRKNYKKLPGCPDIVLPKYRLVVFVNGCFWHMHNGCKRSVLPATNQEYWIKKLNGNRLRDMENVYNLKMQGWKVIVIWECELKKEILESTLSNLRKQIIGNN